MNLSALLDMVEGARVVLIAANSHIQRVPVVAGRYRFPVLGAPPDSAEATLGPGLHRLSPDSPAGSRLRMLKTFTELPVASAFDALACLPTTGP